MDPVLQVPMVDIITLVVAVVLASFITMWLFVQPVIDNLRNIIAQHEANWNDYHVVSQQAYFLEHTEPDELDEFERAAQAVGWGQ